MKEIIERINKDLKKCNEVKNINNLLEMAITIEEIIDSYKNDIKDIVKFEKSNVWLYKKDDLAKVENLLLFNKEKLIKEYNEEITINRFETAIYNIEISKDILENKKVEVIDIINEIKVIIYKDESTSYKWSELRSCLEYISEQDFIVGYELLNLINEVLIIKI